MSSEKMHNVSRRSLLGGAAAFASAAAALPAWAQAAMDNSTEVENDLGHNIRRNVSSFRSLEWQNYFDTTKNGAILVDITSRALHFWSEDQATYKLYPCSVALTDDLTRRGRTEVVEKVVNPPWRPTPSMRERNPEWPELVPGGDPKNPKGMGVSVVGSEGHRQNMLELQRNASERAAAPAPSVAGGFGGGGSTTMSQDLRAKTDAGQTPRGLSPYDTAQLQQQQAQTQQQGELGRAQIAATQTGNNNALRVAEMNNATQRENNAATTRTAMRGHELDFQGRMAPIEVARQQRLRAATYMQGGGAAEGGAGGAGGRYAAAAQAAAANGDDALAQHFATLATGEQSRGAAVDTQQASRAAGTEKLFKPFFTKDVTGKDGTVSQQFDEVGAAKAAATVRGMYGEKFDKLSDDQKRGAILEVVAQQRNADAEAQVMPGFVDRALDVVGLYDKPAPIQGGRRDIRGGKPEKAGLISPPGVSRHDTLLRLPNGQTVNYGVVTDQQIADINERSRLR